MSRLDYITIFIVVIGIAALSYLIFKIFQNNSRQDQNSRISQVEDPYNPNSIDDETTTNLPSEDYNNSITPQDDDYYDEDGSGFQESSSQEEQTSSENDFNSSTKSVSEVDNTPTSNFDNSSSSYGDYMVIAGTFSQKQNAENQVKKLQRLGYQNAAMHLFDRGAYAVVIVDRFDDYSSANRLKNELINDRSVEAIVQKKKN